MPTRVRRRTPASPSISLRIHLQIHQHPPRDLSPLVSSTAEIVKAPASPTTDNRGLDETLGHRDGSCNTNTRDIEQLVLLRRKEAPSSPNEDITQDMEQSEYQYRPMTPGEEEIMRIYEDRSYYPLDMIEKPGGLHLEGSSIRDGRSYTLQATPHHPVVEAYSDSELEELLRDTPEPGTTPAPTPAPEFSLTPGAARISTEAVNVSAGDMGAYVDQLQSLVESLLPWLKDDVSSSGSSNPRTLSPNIALEDILEFEAAAQRNHTPEPCNEVFKFRVPEPEQLNEAEAATQISPDFEHQNELFKFSFEPRGAACRNPDQEQLSRCLDTREALRTNYQHYPRTRRRTTVLERLVEDYSGIEFRPSTGPSIAQKELNVLRSILDRQRTSILSLAERWFSQSSEGPY